MSSESPLRPAGELALNDVVLFQYFHSNRRLWPLTLFFLLMVLLCLIGIIAVAITGDPERLKNPGLYYLIALFWVLLILAGPFVRARRQYRQQKYLRGNMQYHFTNDDMGLVGSSFSGNIAWKLVQKVCETKTLFVIYQTPEQAWVLPKRFFRDQHEITVWKEFVVAHLSSPQLFQPAGWVGAWF